MITITAKGVRNVLFGFDELWGEPLQSVLVRQEPLGLYPRHVPLEYAEILLKPDPNSELFQIFKYTGHAEVWHAEHWRHSASRCVLNAQTRATREQAYHEALVQQQAEYAKFQKVKDKVLRIMPALAHGDSTALVNLVRTLMAAPKELTDKFEGLTALLHEQPTNEFTNESTSI